MRIILALATTLCLSLPVLAQDPPDPTEDAQVKAMEQEAKEHREMVVATKAAFAVANPAASKYINEIEPTILLGAYSYTFDTAADAARDRADKRPVEVFQVYERAARDSDYGTALSFWILNDFLSHPYEKKEAAADTTLRLAMLQAAQNKRLIEQNDRIIALLEAQARKK